MSGVSDQQSTREWAVPGSLEALFWPSVRPLRGSAWHGHVSFAHWIVSVARPRVVVELGTHAGVSFAAFCNASLRSKLHNTCFAIDTWEGDRHAGAYGSEVYDDLSVFVSERFPRSKMIRARFDDALAQFADGSVDLLHIDGLHTYDAVRHDFQSWLPKVSPGGVVLFHDTEVRHGDFGVWQLWDEISNRYPSFNFEHGHGLGVTVPNGVPSGPIAELLATPTDHLPDARKLFAQASDCAHSAGLKIVAAEWKQALAAIPMGRTNLALNCNTIQSSTEGTAKPTSTGATDGTKTGGFGFHTAFERDPWWMVDLGAVKKVSEIVVYNRLDNDCASRASSLQIAVSDDGAQWSLVYSAGGRSFGGADGRPLRVPLRDMSARFFWLMLKAETYFHLDEVEIYGPAATTPAPANSSQGWFRRPQAPETSAHS